MPMTVNKLMRGASERSYLKSNYRNIIENHLQLLKNSSRLHPVPIEGIKEIKYRGDFFGLLKSMNIKPEHHWIIMRMNNLHSPMDYQGTMEEIIIPSSDKLELYLRRWMNSPNFV